MLPAKQIPPQALELRIFLHQQQRNLYSPPERKLVFWKNKNTHRLAVESQER